MSTRQGFLSRPRIMALLIAWWAFVPVLPGPCGATESNDTGQTATAFSAYGTGIPVAAGLVVGATERSGFTLYGPGGAIAVGGLLVGPSLGHFHAHAPARAWRGLAIRGVGMGAYAAAYASRTADGQVGSGIGILGVVVAAASALADIADAGASAQRENARRASTGTSWTPVLRATGRVAGIGVRTAF